jgi:hypothetical protein
MVPVTSTICLFGIAETDTIKETSGETRPALSTEENRKTI